ncbi:histo-blood group ABO system transferase 2-like [Boleophthalmus pectinirostris]|uniref:histo-blood group ABO system transferase 2-like n=1 Tax=Boleophthalmus pectinirostris TaxID=150288 RepID=UPI00242F8923|nr:histo-blood group ABO system transferase 2-like [Boleophthalmus pectinirostris]
MACGRKLHQSGAFAAPLLNCLPDDSSSSKYILQLEYHVATHQNTLYHTSVEDPEDSGGERGVFWFPQEVQSLLGLFPDRKDVLASGQIPLTQGRNISIHDVPSANRWQDVVLSKMKWAKLALETWLHREADYLFMMDVDSVFRGHVGAEALSRLVGTLHRMYYRTTKREDFPYERRPESQAYIPPTEGDYYYTAAVWGGLLDDMYRLVKHCDEKSQEDAKIGVEAAWQEESHLNKYFLYNKPTKVLSPEYLWSDYEGSIPADIRVVRIAQLVKNYQEVRPN